MKENFLTGLRITLAFTIVHKSNRFKNIYCFLLNLNSSVFFYIIIEQSYVVS